MHEFTFRWTVPEYGRAARAIARHAGTRNWLNVTVWVVLGLVLASIFFRPEAQTSMLPAVLLFVLAAVLLLAPRVVPWLTARRILKDDPCAQDDVRHIVSPEAFKVRSTAVTVDVNWTHIRRVVETPEFFLFYFAKQTAYFTPKRAIPEADLGNLRASLRACVGSKAILGADTQAAA